MNQEKIKIEIYLENVQKVFVINVTKAIIKEKDAEMR